MATVPPINTSVIATSALDLPTSSTTASPGCLPSTMTCWQPSHSRHVWPTTPGSKFHIQDCELYCFYCAENGYRGKWYGKANVLRVHVFEAHLSEGALKGVHLICGNGIGRVYAKSQIKKAKRSTYLPDRTLDPQIQLSQLDSIFWLSPEHHVGFRRLMRVFFSHKTSALESAVASFLHVHGSLLWPDSPESRHHLSPSNNPISASYFDVMIKPTYSVQGGWQDLEEDDSWLNMQEESRMCSRIS